MVKRRRFNVRIGLRFPPLGVRGLSRYWHGGIWKDIWQHMGSLNVPAIAMEATFLWSLGLTAGSFALLQGSQPWVTLPPATLTLCFAVAELLGLEAEDLGPGLSRIWAGLILVVAWLCLVGAWGRSRDCQS